MPLPEPDPSAALGWEVGGEGTILANRYLLAEAIGHGGMGVVYRATDLRTGGDVAVKLIHPTVALDPASADRFRREAQLAAALTSARVVRVTDLDTYRGLLFLVMEYVPGPTLAELLRERGPLPPAEALVVCREVAWALDAAHAKGIVHRDLKPENIKFVDGQVKVLDFGIAREVGGPHLTSPGFFVGTPQYCAPERLTGEGDIRSDLYSLGLILIALVEGRPPFADLTPHALLLRLAGGPPPIPDSIGEPLRSLLERCLAPVPAERCQTPAELAGMLDRAIAAIAAPGADPPAENEAAAAAPDAADTAAVTVAAPPAAETRRVALMHRARVRRTALGWAGAGVAVVGAGGLLAAALLWNRGGPEANGAAPGAAATPAPLAGDLTPAPAVTLTSTAVPTPPPASTSDSTAQQVSAVLAQAIAGRGYVASGPVVSVPAGGGAVLLIQRGDGADGQRLFMALGDRFLGTDWEDASPRGVSNAVAAGSGRFSATYANEPGRQAVVVTFTWDGSRMRPDGVAPGHCLPTTGC